MNVQKLIGALRPFGDVLEVGFGASSKEIEKYHPKSHTIISSDPEAVNWAKDHLGVKVIADIWQSALPELGVFDTIYFGIDPESYDFLIRFKYTNDELDLFCKTVVEKEYLAGFLVELEQNGQITQEQLEQNLKKYKLSPAKPAPRKRSKEMIHFLKSCLLSHMRKGSRFSCYLKSEIDDEEFYDEILVDPSLDIRQDGLIITIEKLLA